MRILTTRWTVMTRTLLVTRRMEGGQLAWLLRSRSLLSLLWNMRRVIKIMHKETCHIGLLFKFKGTPLLGMVFVQMTLTSPEAKSVTFPATSSTSGPRLKSAKASHWQQNQEAGDWWEQEEDGINSRLPGQGSRWNPGLVGTKLCLHQASSAAEDNAGEREFSLWLSLAVSKWQLHQQDCVLVEDVCCAEGLQQAIGAAQQKNIR